MHTETPYLRNLVKEMRCIDCSYEYKLQKIHLYILRFWVIILT